MIEHSETSIPSFYHRYLDMLRTKKTAMVPQVEKLLEKCMKPARYIGVEPYTRYKDIDENRYLALLSYPDIYDIAMSNLTIRLFYETLNELPGVRAERVFMPAPDMADLLEAEKVPLFSLETWTPCREASLFAFTVQTELTYTNLLAMLSMALIPIEKSGRGPNDPLVIAGGVSMINPMPLADFIDLVFIGDGERAVADIVRMDRDLVNAGADRYERMRRLASIPGVFVPGSGTSTIRVVEQDLDSLSYPEVQILPLVKPVQDRPVMEIAKGCNNGCRFCQASFAYRPYRERDPLIIAEKAKKTIDHTGYDELNLTSLSVADYSRISELVGALEKYFSSRHVSISLPSLRIHSFNVALLDSLSSVRKGGLTFAVEAGCREFRDAINKEFDEQSFYTIIESLIAKGWRLVKFYFILGFPGLQNEEDAIISFLDTVVQRFPSLELNVSVALFIPKPLTPLENEEQLDEKTFIEKAKKIKDAYRTKRRVHIKYHDPLHSKLEFFFANGGNEAGVLLRRAVDAGVRYDAWNEFFAEDFYRKELEQVQIKPATYRQVLNPLIGEEFIAAERARYDTRTKLESCIQGACSLCGACLPGERENRLCPLRTEEELTHLLEGISGEHFCVDLLTPSDAALSYMLRFDKTGLYRYVGHLDFYVLFIRILKLAGFSLVYSQGYNPVPKISFPFPASLGMESQNDVLFFSAQSSILSEGVLVERMNRFLPEGFRWHSLEIIGSAREEKKQRRWFQTLRFEKSIDPFPVHAEIAAKCADAAIGLLECSFDSATLTVKTELGENQKNVAKMIYPSGHCTRTIGHEPV